MLSKQVSRYFILVILLAIMYGCVRVNQVTTLSPRNFAMIYNPGVSPLHPEYKIFHLNDTSTLIYFKLNPNELLYSQVEEGQFKSKLKIHYTIYSSFQFEKIIDSSSTFLVLKKKNGMDELITYIAIKPQMEKQYVLEIVATDLLRNRSSYHVFHINKELFSTQFGLLNYSESQKIGFHFNTQPAQQCYLQNSYTKSNEFFIKYYKPANHFLPLPPYSSNDNLPVYEPDTLWKIDASQRLTFNPTEPGIYLIQPDTSTNYSIPIICSSKAFQTLKTPAQLIEPLVYLTNAQEYKDLCNATNKKFELDNYWLSLGGNPARSKDLIKIFYNRVSFSNLYFSSYKEGWKTDRGMIYILFGPPKYVNKSEKVEKWTYSSGSNFNTIAFVFQKTSKSLTDNDFILNRSITYKTPWFTAVETWKSGKVYSY